MSERNIVLTESLCRRILSAMTWLLTGSPCPDCGGTCSADSRPVRPCNREAAQKVLADAKKTMRL